jgi:hypothetical protein
VHVVATQHAAQRAARERRTHLPSYVFGATVTFAVRLFALIVPVVIAVGASV